MEGREGWQNELSEGRIPEACGPSWEGAGRGLEKEISFGGWEEHGEVRGRRMSSWVESVMEKRPFFEETRILRNEPGPYD